MTSAYLPSRLDIACSMVQNGRMVELPRESRELFPVEMVALVETFLAVIIVHESEDSVTGVCDLWKR